MPGTISAAAAISRMINLPFMFPPEETSKMPIYQPLTFLPISFAIWWEITTPIPSYVNSHSDTGIHQFTLKFCSVYGRTNFSDRSDRSQFEYDDGDRNSSNASRARASRAGAVHVSLEPNADEEGYKG